MVPGAGPSSTRALDTGFFAVAGEVGPTMLLSVRCLQTVTIAAAAFAILGACGLPPPGRGPRVVVRPHRPAREITIRSVTGDWNASRRTAGGAQALRLSLIQRGDTLQGTLSVGTLTVATDPATPARLGVDGSFVLVFVHSPENIVLRGRPDASGERIPVAISGVGPELLAVVFRRR